MAETRKNDTRSSRKPAAKDDPDPFFSVNFAEASMRGASLMAQANGILLQTARQIWDKQAELLQPPHFPAPGAADGGALPGLLEQWHDSAEKAVGQIRAIQDLMRDCEWRLLAMAAETMPAAQKEAE